MPRSRERLKLQHSAVIYGSNASGKSNVLKALKFMDDFVQNSMDNKPESKIDVTPFRLDASTLYKPSESDGDIVSDEHICGVSIRIQWTFRRTLFD